MVRLVLGMVVSLLPKPYRGWWAGASAADFRRATILSGLVEALGCLGLYIVRYFYFIQYRVGSIAEAAARRWASRLRKIRHRICQSAGIHP